MTFVCFLSFRKAPAAAGGSIANWCYDLNCYISPSTNLLYVQALHHSIFLVGYSVFHHLLPATRLPLHPAGTPTTASLRGLSVVERQVAWASGSAGIVLRTTDGGTTWTNRPVPNADSLDFRSLQALAPTRAFVLSAGAPALLYHTTDGGTTWRLRYENRTPGIFFDALTFWDTTHGMAMSDPVDGQFFLIATHDGGHTWQQLPTDNMPPPAAGEAGFAASNSGLATRGEQHVWLATGGAKARVFRSVDRERTGAWQHPDAAGRTPRRASFPW